MIDLVAQLKSLAKKTKGGVHLSVYPSGVMRLDVFRDTDKVRSFVRYEATASDLEQLIEGVRSEST